MCVVVVLWSICMSANTAIHHVTVCNNKSDTECNESLYGSPPKGRQSLLLGGQMNILCIQVQKEGEIKISTER